MSQEVRNMNGRPICRRGESPVNPWGLTPHQVAVLAASAALGSSKLVARQLGISYKIVEQHLRDAKREMGVAHRVIAVVMWDRYTRGRPASSVWVYAQRLTA